MGGKVLEGGFLAAWCPGKVDEPSQLHGVFLPRAMGGTGGGGRGRVLGG